MIHAEDLKKSFGSVSALGGVSFDVARGEVVGLLGPNGAGKTTTMRIITGYIAADFGQVTIDGIPVRDDSVETRSRIGYLPENAPLYTDLEVSEHLEYISRLRGIGGDARSAIRDMVDLCGLRNVLGRKVGELSKGFRQRVGLAQAMIHRPPILILDEPTSGLDPNQIIEIRDLIREIGRERTVVLSTHILQEVEATCSRALIIDSGKLVGEGTIEELRGRSVARAHYRVAIRAERDMITQALERLDGLEVDEWLASDSSGRQRLLLRCDGTDDRSEDIFEWAKSEGFVLAELARESASLEDVFKELTQGSEPGTRNPGLGKKR
jgi:ABC-2 type transport system ATP-binding protein